jgi:hypothetical protein
MKPGRDPFERGRLVQHERVRIAKTKPYRISTEEMVRFLQQAGLEPAMLKRLHELSYPYRFTRASR